ncbi:MAG: nucleoside 2-deoxyribosyltransferase domain-containing protein [Propionibacteriaceae bacterium]|nr:nucleoside 2-deoxyribosyltransferase domain-containing protein [Propionibacteriaceae bacterium]
MITVLSPETDSDHTVGPADVFLAGGITGCPNWQQKAISLIKAAATGLVVDNPRRSQAIPDHGHQAMAQISWEHCNLTSAGLILVHAGWITTTDEQDLTLGGTNNWQPWEAGIQHDARCPCALADHHGALNQPTSTRNGTHLNTGVEVQVFTLYGGCVGQGVRPRPASPGGTETMKTKGNDTTSTTAEAPRYQWRRPERARRWPLATPALEAQAPDGAALSLYLDYGDGEVDAEITVEDPDGAVWSTSSSAHWPRIEAYLPRTQWPAPSTPATAAPAPRRARPTRPSPRPWAPCAPRW